MKASKFSEAQVAFALKQAQDGTPDRVPANGVASAIAVPSGQSRELVSLRLAG